MNEASAITWSIWWPVQSGYSSIFLHIKSCKWGRCRYCSSNCSLHHLTHTQFWWAPTASWSTSTTSITTGTTQRTRAITSTRVTGNTIWENDNRNRISLLKDYMLIVSAHWSLLHTQFAMSCMESAASNYALSSFLLNCTKASSASLKVMYYEKEGNFWNSCLPLLTLLWHLSLKILEIIFFQNQSFQSQATCFTFETKSVTNFFFFLFSFACQSQETHYWPQNKCKRP